MAISMSKLASLAILLAHAEARFGQEQTPVAAVAALGEAGFGEPGVAATIAGSIPGSLLAAAGPCQKLTIADQVIDELGDDQQVVDAAIGLVSAETNFNPFAVDVPFVCADRRLPASAQLRGITPLVDPAVGGSDVANAQSATSVQTPFNAEGLSQAEVLIAQGFSNFTAVGADGVNVVLAGQDGAAGGDAAGDDAAGDDAAGDDAGEVEEPTGCGIPGGNNQGVLPPDNKAGNGTADNGNAGEGKVNPGNSTAPDEGNNGGQGGAGNGETDDADDADDADNAAGDDAADEENEHPGNAGNDNYNAEDDNDDSDNGAGRGEGRGGNGRGQGRGGLLNRLRQGGNGSNRGGRGGNEHDGNNDNNNDNQNADENNDANQGNNDDDAAGDDTAGDDAAGDNAHDGANNGDNGQDNGQGNGQDDGQGTDGAAGDDAAAGDNNAEDDAADGGNAGDAVDTGDLDFGVCQPTMARVGGLNGRPADEFTFIPQDPLVAEGQQEALNPNIITNRICDQLTNVCQANDAAKAACKDAQAEIEALGTRDQSTADTWNALLGFAGEDSTKQVV